MDMGVVCPQDVKKMLLKHARMIHWKRWAAKHVCEELKAAKKRGDKMQAAAEHQAWENRKVQVTVDKKEDTPNVKDW